MNCVGIICEYNPFHNGHLFHLREASQRADDAPIVAVMSGNYVQRAEPAITDKWTRTRMALENGASIVLELPTCYSTAGSESFAGSAVHILNQTGIITHLSFGTESMIPSLLKAASHIVLQEPENYTILLKKFLCEGLGYASARAKALSELLSVEPDIFRAPNTILAIEYYKALERESSSIIPIPVERSGNYHDLSINTDFPSASAIRSAIRKNIAFTQAVPSSTASLLTPETVAMPFDDWSKELIYRLCFHDAKSLREIYEIGEGLENRILQYAVPSKSISELVDLISTKRYPKSRIRRILLNILLDITTEFHDQIHYKDGPSYIRVLGFRKDAEKLLSMMTEKAGLPVITNLPRQLHMLPDHARLMLESEIRYSDLYFAHIAKKTVSGRNMELTQPLVIL